MSADKQGRYCMRRKAMGAGVASSLVPCGRVSARYGLCELHARHWERKRDAYLAKAKAKGAA